MRRIWTILMCGIFILFSSLLCVRVGHAGTAGSSWITDSVFFSEPYTYSYVSPALGADNVGNLYAATRGYYNVSEQTMVYSSKSIDGGRTWNWTFGSGGGTNTQSPSLAVASGGNNQVLIAYEENYPSISGIQFEVWIGTGSSGWTLVNSAYVHNPQLVVDTNLPIYAYLVYENDSSGIPGDSDIYFMRSIDYANNWTTWEEPYALAGASDTVTYTNPTIAYGANGNLYVAFERKNGAAASEIYFMHNTGYGNRANWGYTPGTLISPPNIWNKHRPRMAASHTSPGTVIVTWEEEYSTTDYDVGYAYSTDTGNAWNPSALYLARTYDNERKPTIAADDSGYFHIAYWSNASAGSRINGIFYHETTWDAPEVWTNAEQLIDDNGHADEIFNEPAITVQERGGAFYPVVSWTDSRESNPNVYCTTRGARYIVASNPASSNGLPLVQVDNDSYATPAAFNWPAGLNHSIEVSSPQVGTGVRYVFSSWSDGGSQKHAVTAGTADATLTANFVKQYGLTVSTDPVYLNPQPDTAPNGPWYDIGVLVNITAQKVIGSYSLDHWTVDGSDFPPDETVSVTMDQAHNVIAKYGLDTTAPLISDLVQNPPGQQIAPGSGVNVQVTVTDTETGVKNVTLRYRTSTDNATWSDWIDTSMNEVARDTYSDTIVGFSADTYVQYKVNAFDNAGNSRTLPAALYYYYFVVPELPSLLMTVIFLSSASTLLFLRKIRRTR